MKLVRTEERRRSIESIYLDSLARKTKNSREILFQIGDTIESRIDLTGQEFIQGASGLTFKLIPLQRTRYGWLYRIADICESVETEDYEPDTISINWIDTIQ